MFSKFKEVEINEYDEKYERMWLNLQGTQTVLSSAVKASYVKNACICVYPDGPDKNKAVSDAQKAKRTLLGAISSYDEQKQELTNFYVQYRIFLEKCKTWNPNHFCDSHKIIEVTIENFIKGS